MEDVETAYYLRMKVKDEPGVLADITRILGDKGISIEAIIQKEPKDGSSKANVIMLTHRVVEKQMNEAIQKIESLNTISGEVTRIRMESLEAS
jgi:homoserine dehydrogenase